MPRPTSTRLAVSLAALLFAAGCESPQDEPTGDTTTGKFGLSPLEIAGLDVTDATAAPSVAARLPAHMVTNDAWIVVLDDHADPHAVAAWAGVRPGFVYEHALKGFAATLPPSAIQALQRHPDVRFLDRDRPVFASAQTLPTGVDRMDADLNATSAIAGDGGDVDIDVAVIDTGVDLDHPDLNVVASTSCTGGPFNKKCSGTGDDDNGHGTHVAGTIGARDNGIGVVGIAPGARIWAVKVLKSDGSGWTSNIIGGIDWVTARKSQIEVVNMSLGGPGSDDTNGGDCSSTTDAQHLAICNSTKAGVVYVVAAGNDAKNSAGFTPAAYDEVITVSALADFDGQPGGLQDQTVTFSICTETQDDSFACFSNFGADVDVLAPGVLIYSTRPGGTYGNSSGTSMASPHVAGAAALALVGQPKPTNLAGVLAVRDALVAAGIPAPCDTPTGRCTDDPDGVQEPMAYVGPPGCQSNADCDDALACTIDTCTAGECSNAQVSCDDANACTTDACDPATGLCSNAAVACDDGLACNGLEGCDPATGCTGGAPIACDDLNACTTDSCDDATGACTNTPVACDDGDACNGLETCEVATGCVAGAPVSCDDANACTSDTCDPATGACSNAAVACDDGNACNGLETCDVFVGCVAGTAVSCNDGNACTTDSCDPATGACSNAAVSCGDGNACNGLEGCDPATGCFAGSPVDCNDANVCTSDSCDPATGACSNLATPCDDGDLCTADGCDPVAGCTFTPSGTCGADGCCVEGCSDPDCVTAVCGDGVCEGSSQGEDCGTCPVDCACKGKNCFKACCGDGVCKGETALSCPVDCQ